MYKYECDYCENSLCPEECDKAKEHRRLAEKKRVLIDKDYCSSVVWFECANWEESDFNFNEDQIKLAKDYDNLWEEAYRDIENVDEVAYSKAEKAKFALLKNLYLTRKDIEWCYWDEENGKEVVYCE